MIINQLDLGGPSHPFATPIVGQELGSVMVEGYEPSIWPRGSVARSQTVSFWIKAWQALGGAAAGSSAAMKYLLKQVEELASSRDQQPVYIQWTATADSTAQLNASELHDGWYIIDNFEPSYVRNVMTGLVSCQMIVTQVGAGAPRSAALGYTGGALSSNFSGQALNLLATPVGSTALETTFNRTAAEGNIPSIVSPVASPEPLVLSTTIANIFKGGCHVYDTINTGSNPVPSSGGTFVNANWVEVFYTDHNFTGDCVITNGLQLLIFTAASAQTATCYLWNTATATANWQQYGTIAYDDNALAGGATLRQYALTRVGPEEVSIVAISSNANAGAQVAIRLQRGRYEVRADLKPQTQTTTNGFSLFLTLPASAKIAYNSTHVADLALAESTPAAVTDYGYGAVFINSNTYPFVAGFLYQNQPGASQPGFSGTTFIGLGDTTSLAINAQRSYGFFAIPYGVSGSYSTLNLQAEAEGGTLDAGWTSQANASASAGNEAKCASGTSINRADVFGTAFVPNPGTYDIWFRVKVTSAAGAVTEMQLALWNSTDSVTVASTNYKANQVTTSYAWYRVAAAVTPTATKNMRFRAITAATVGTDWFIDEAVMVPLTLTTDNRGPQSIAQHFGYDRSVRMVRP